MANLADLFNTLLLELNKITLQSATPKLAQIQLIFGIITTIITTQYQNDPSIKYKDDADDVLSKGKVLI